MPAKTETYTKRIRAVFEVSGSAKVVKVVNDVSNKVRKLANTFMKFGIAAAGAFAVQSVRKALAFEEAIHQVNTIAKLSQGELSVLAERVRSLSLAFGVDAVDATKALYQALSAGVSSAESIQFMETAFKAAAAGAAEVDQVVAVLAKTINAYGMSYSDVNKVSDIFFKTVEKGITTMRELSAYMGNVLSTAATTKTSFKDLMAAIATMTKGGIDTAKATISINQALIALAAPTQQAIDASKKYGVQLGATRLQQVGFIKMLNEIKDATGGDLQKIQKLLPNIRALRVILPLTGEQADEFQKILKDMEGSLGATQSAFSEMNTKAMDARRALQFVNDISIEVGSSLADMLAPKIVAGSESMEAFGIRTEIASKKASAALIAFLYPFTSLLDGLAMLPRLLEGKFKLEELMSFTNSILEQTNKLVGDQIALEERLKKLTSEKTQEQLQSIKSINELKRTNIELLQQELNWNMQNASVIESLNSSYKDVISSELNRIMQIPGVLQAINEAKNREISLDEQLFNLDKARLLVQDLLADQSIAKDTSSYVELTTKLSEIAEAQRYLKEQMQLASDAAIVQTEAIKDETTAVVEMETSLSDLVASWIRAGEAAKSMADDMLLEYWNTQLEQFSQANSLLTQLAENYNVYVEATTSGLDVVADYSQTVNDTLLNVFSNFTEGLSGSLNSILWGTMTAGEAAKNILKAVTGAFISMLVKLVAQTALFNALQSKLSKKKFASELGISSGLAAAHTVEWITATYPWPMSMALAAIWGPFMQAFTVAQGVSGYAAGFGAGLGIPGYGEGGIVDLAAGEPTLAVVHGGEMILNRTQQQALFETLTSAGTSNTSGGGASISISINAIDGESVERLVSSSEFQEALADAISRSGVLQASIVDSSYELNSEKL